MNIAANLAEAVNFNSLPKSAAALIRSCDSFEAHGPFSISGRRGGATVASVSTFEIGGKTFVGSVHADGGHFTRNETLYSMRNAELVRLMAKA